VLSHSLDDPLSLMPPIGALATRYPGHFRPTSVPPLPHVSSPCINHRPVTNLLLAGHRTAAFDFQPNPTPIHLSHAPLRPKTHPQL
jgi:hypothetical protein